MGMGDPYVRSNGERTVPAAALTAGTLTYGKQAYERAALHEFSWTNAMVVAAAGSSNKINVCTLPAKTVVRRAWIIIDTAATQAATLTVQAGTAADTDGYLLAGNAKSAANTVYGDADAEVGVLLFDAADDHWLDNLPSYTGTTVVQIEFTIGAGTLADVTASTGRVILETVTLP